MARNIVALLLLFAYGSCMEIRETVERMVMVRSTGSDLQPAATGYIYKKESDGPASVTKMGETEVMEHFSKLYDESEEFTAPPHAPVGPFHTNEEDDDKAATHTSEKHVKPVVEHTSEHEDAIDGIASESYDNIFKEYAKRYGSGYKGDFSDYLHGIGHFDHGIHHDYGSGKDYGSKGFHDFGKKGYDGYGTNNFFEKGNAEDYHSGKHEHFATSKAGGGKEDYDEADGHGKHYIIGDGYKDDDNGYKQGHAKGEEVDGYHKVFNKQEFKKDQDFYDGEGVKGGHHKFADGHEHHGSEAGGHKKGDSHDSKHFKSDHGKGGYVDKQSGDEHESEDSSEKGGSSHVHHEGEFGTKGGDYTGKRYGYEIKH